ncbi:alpha/beta hydrolase [Marinobacter nanhaiticus D15-8W]|uniref:Alpha/beta hydrolase n=1 Tax=Marinobacter nanhaiticus D15-8W TaxID=626887 RepID=N6WSL4_9GAMM|nr:alpha/beta hydrolase [Marinobacter nanhaiticus]ENO14032.2 alpha/beta hydrolase [Marinobacter nanhaiticus D15-8W]BES71412.1 alpha/beta hydrolase [Marinobacter nanhaiticus D15-8W]
MPYANVNDVNLYYECHGKGAPLMLIAGLASDSQSWGPVIDELSQHYLVIVLDNRGVGRTTPQDGGTSIQHMANDCMALLDYLELPDASLLGHSMGGFVALDCTIRYPARVSKLILAGTSALNSDRNNSLFQDWVADLKTGMDAATWFRNIFYSIFSDRFFENKETVTEAIRFAVEYPYPQGVTAFEQQVDAIAAFNCLDQLPNITQETMVICGKQDLLFPSEESSNVFQVIPHVSIKVLDDAAHSIHMEVPGAFLAHVVNFLSAEDVPPRQDVG